MILLILTYKYHVQFVHSEAQGFVILLILTYKYHVQFVHSEAQGFVILHCEVQELR